MDGPLEDTAEWSESFDLTERLARHLLQNDPSNRSGLRFECAVRNTQRLYLARARLAIEFLKTEAESSHTAALEK
ncbi:MAG TPA: hypothetical protein VFM24_02885 [Nitrospira sp.]|nr:hypothetical protein [Nitrospira sp.]